jgi:hypothetical protein
MTSNKMIVFNETLKYRIYCGIIITAASVV